MIKPTTMTMESPLDNRVKESAKVGERHGGKLKVAIIMSRFPKLTETFVFYEMLAVERHGVQIEIYPLLREKTDVMQPEAHAYVERAHYQPFISWPILRSHIRFLWRKPRTYLSTLWTVLRANWGSMRYFTGALGIFPKTIHFAYLMKEDRVEHVHAHFASHPAAAAFIIQRMTGIPYSFSGHGSDLNRDQHMLCEKVAEASFVVPNSNFFKELILGHCGEQYHDKVIVIHSGVDTQLFQPSHRERHVPSADDFNIYCVGTLHEVKGQTYLIEACRLLHERGVEFTCHFIGDGPDRADLTEQVEQASLSEFVQFHGLHTRAEIAKLLQDATVLVTPSVPTKDGKREGIPLVLMEAMSSGLPVVSTAFAGIPELVDDKCNGFLTAPGDVLAIADALELLHNDPGLRQQFARAGREKVLDKFDQDKNALTLTRHLYEKHQ